MDKFIRHLDTKDYLTEEGKWTSDLEKAWCVQDLEVAADRIIALGHYDVEICCALDTATKDEAWQYTIPFR